MFEFTCPHCPRLFRVGAQWDEFVHVDSCGEVPNGQEVSVWWGRIICCASSAVPFTVVLCDVWRSTHWRCCWYFRSSAIYILKNSSKLVDPTICRVLDTSPGDTGFLPQTGWRIMSQISLLVCDTGCSLCKSRRITGNHPYSNTNYKVLSKPTELQQQDNSMVTGRIIELF